MRAGLVLLTFGLFFALALGEAGFRLVDRFTCQDDSGWFWEPDIQFGWRHTPGLGRWARRCDHGKPEWEVYTRINSHGLRDREIPYEHGPTPRILVLGDSFAEALQVEQEQTFAKLLEQRLGVEVVDTGDSGYGTDNELLFFLHEGWKYRPDLVLLMFNTSNDILENDNDLLRGTSFPYPDKPYFDLADDRLTLRRYPLQQPGLRRRFREEAHLALQRHSALYRRLTTLWLTATLPEAHAAPPPALGEVLPRDVYRKDYPEVWREAWRITRGLVLRLRREVEARGSRFAVVVLNGKEEVWPKYADWSRGRPPRLSPEQWDLDKPNRLATGFLRRRGIPTIPLLDAFRAHYRETGAPGYYSLDVHWNAVGHDLAARTIERGLRDLDLVPRR